MKAEEVKRRWRALLAERGLTQADLARGASISSTVVSHYVNGHFGPSPQTYQKLAELLDTDVDELKRTLYGPGDGERSASPVMIGPVEIVEPGVVVALRLGCLEQAVTMLRGAAPTPEAAAVLTLAEQFEAWATRT